MINTSLYIKDNKKLISLFLIFFASRIIIYFTFIDQTSLTLDNNYLTALNDNFFDYFKCSFKNEVTVLR